MSKLSQFNQPAAVSRAIAAPSMPLRAQLRQWMVQCRQSTLALFATVDHDTFCQQAHSDFSPIGWHLGHIAYTEALWLLEQCAGMPPQFPEYRRLFAADTLPKADRVNLPTIATVQHYLATVREAVFNYLEVAPLDSQERLWRWLLQHESQHAETIALVLALIRHPVPQSAIVPATVSAQATQPTAMVPIPAGYAVCGNAAIDALDNERPLHQVYLNAYRIDRHPVTQGQFWEFMAAGGYRNAEWWSPDGWQWQQTAQVFQPRYWSTAPGWERLPVCGVSWYEADAYARFVGKRLPTELEWEKAANWNPTTIEPALYPWGNAVIDRQRCNHGQLVGHATPVDAYPEGVSFSGCADMLGNVWEWTGSWFDGYEGFTAYPYKGYSQAYFDQQHRVLRGGSWATFPWALRTPFRNWYYPHMREMLAGFRCAADAL